MLVLRGHSGSVQALAFTRDGSLLASASHDRTVKLWDARSHRECRTLHGHTGPVECLAFSANEHYLASGGLDETVRLWDPSSGVERRCLAGHWPLVTAIAFSPDGQLMATASGDRVSRSEDGAVMAAKDGELRLWDMPEAQWRADILKHMERLLEFPIGSVWSLAWSLDSRILVAGTEYRALVLWDVAAHRPERTFQMRGGVRAIAYSPDGRFLAAAASWGIELRDTASDGYRLSELISHRGVVTSIAYAPDGRTLLSGGRDRAVKIWDVATGRERASFDWQIGPVNAVAVSPDGMTAAAGGQSGDIVLWDLDMYS